MMVWLHTSSPPQHIADCSETHVSPSGRMETFVEDIEHRRGIIVGFCGVFENEYGKISVHVFDTKERANVWMERNKNKMDRII